MQQGARQNQAKAAGQWLSGEIDSLRKKVADAESRVEEFRSKSSLFIGTNNTSLSNQQLGEINTQLNNARALKSDAESKARMIKDVLNSGRPIESSEVLNSELIRRLSEQRVTLRAQLAEQSSTLLDRHPRIRELKAQVADLDRQLREEAAKVSRSLESDARIAAGRVEGLTSSLEQSKRQATSSNGQDVQLRALEREAKAQRALLESYLAKYREATTRENIDAAPADGRIISRPVVSNTPAYPKKLPIVLIATLATLLATAIGTALGAVSGFLSGRIGDLLEWVYNVCTSIPGILLIFAFAAVFGRGTATVVLILGLTGWTGIYRLVRAEFLKHAVRDYVRAAEAIGASVASRMFRHILPNVSHVVLVQLSIRDIVLIDRLDLAFAPGLSVLTGETGAGKSILLDSLSLALGGRGDGNLVRHGEEKGQVTAVFDVLPLHPLRRLLRDNGIDEDGDIIFRRVQSADGRSRAFVNDQPVSVQLLREAGSHLVEIHGQHDDRALVDTEAHRMLLDAFAGLSEEAESVARLFRQWRDFGRALKSHRAKVEAAAREADYLRSSVAELEKLAPVDGEEDDLAEKRATMMKSERIAGDISE
eukprot:gene34087-45698_t